MSIAALRTGRAVAILMIASGLAGIMSISWPALDTRWLFVLAVAAIAALDGWAIALVSAIAAALCYEAAAFGALPIPGRDAALVGLAIAAIAVARAVRAAAQPRQLGSARPQLLLVERTEDPDDTATRRELAAANSRLAEQARAIEERKRMLDEAVSDAARRGAALQDRVGALEHELREAERARAAASDEVERLREEHERQAGDAAARAESERALLARLRDLERANAQLRVSQIAADEHRIAREIEIAEQMKRDLIEAEAAAENEAARAADLAERIDLLERGAADLQAQYAAAVESLANRTAAVGRQHQDALEAAEVRMTAAEQHAEIVAAEKDEVERANADLNARLAAAGVRVAQAESRAAEEADRLRAALETSQEQDERFAALRDTAAREGERVRDLEAAVARLERDLARMTEERAAAQDATREASIRIVQLESEQLQLRQIASDAAAEAVAAERRAEAAQAEADELVARVQELEPEALNATVAEADARELAERVAALEQERARLIAEHDKNLQTIVSHLASDHEIDVGHALAEREEARAEVRRLEMRLAAVTRTLESEREAFLSEREAWTRTAAAPPQQVEPAPERVLPRARILLVHHDAGVRALAKHTLDESGYDTVTAAEGLEAFRVAVSHQPDVVIAESQMAKMDGRELTQMLRMRRETSAAKVVLLKPVTSVDAVGASHRSDDFLRTPAGLDALKATLEGVLSGRSRA